MSIAVIKNCKNVDERNYILEGKTTNFIETNKVGTERKQSA